MPGTSRYDEHAKLMDLMQAIVDADESTTVVDIRHFIDAVNAVRFNRQKVNNDLADISIRSA